MSERKGRTAMAAFVIAFSVAVVMVIASLSFGFLRGALRKAEAAFPPGTLQIRPKAFNIAMLSINTGAITDQVVERVRSMPGVEYAAPQLPMKMPLRAEGDIMGNAVGTEALIVGIDPVLVRKEVKPGLKFEYDARTTEPVPCMLPRAFLDMYNLAYSESMGLPKINEDFALGRHFKLMLGESFSGVEGTKKKEVNCRIVGLTANPALHVGVLIPLRYADEFNKWYMGRSEHKYSVLHVKVRELKNLDTVTSQVQSMGYLVESNKESLQRFQSMIRIAGLASWVFGLIVLAIAATSIFNTFSLIMGQRRGEVGLLRAVGGTRRLIIGLFASEVVAIGFCGGTLGVVVTWGVLRWVDSALAVRFQNMSFMPEHMFVTTWPMVLTCIGGAVLLSMLATFPIIRRTANTPPAVLVSET